MRLKNEYAVIIVTGVAIACLLIGITLNPSKTLPQGFVSTPAYDSGWLNITDKTGKYFNITHNLSSTNIIVDITGKRMADDEAHQINLGGTDFIVEQGTEYGGEQQDIAYALVHTVDGGYAMAGYTYTSNGLPNRDFWLVKTDANRNMQWNKTYGGASHDNAYSLIETSDEGYAMVGYTNSYGAGNADFWLVKTDSAGNVEWNQTYGGPDDDEAWSVVETGDKGYAMVGYTNSYGAGNADFWLVKTDSAGNVEWNQTYGGPGDDTAYSFVATIDGGYAITGRTGSDSRLIKVDSSGNHEWNNTYGGANDEYAASVIQTSDGGYAIAGSSGAISYDFWLAKTDSSGNQQWTQTYGGSNNEVARCIIQASDGGYVLAGYTDSFGAGEFDFWLVKTNSTGNIIWSKTYGGADYEEARSVIETPDGGYAVAGYTYPSGGGDFWLVKTDAYGNIFPYTFKYGLAWTNSTADTITMYRGTIDPYWNYVRVRIWKIEGTP